MNEKILLIIALVCIITGLPILYIASQFVNADDPRILTELTGTVDRVKQMEKITIVNVKPDKSIPVIFFDNVRYVSGDKIAVKGQLKSYKNQLEFVAEE